MPGRQEDRPASGGARLVALRGATTVTADEPEAIMAATVELLEQLLERNSARPADLVSLFFTATPDLRSEFPAAAARRMGLGDVALLCASELAVTGAPARCVRVLAHLYSEKARHGLEHVYLHGARALRPDLEP